MTTLITGGSKCGKSSYAEKLIEGFGGRKIYIATMQPYGEEAFAAIARHREMRRGKGFVTVEKYTDIDEIEIPAGSTVLLECIGNLLANEMFRDGNIYDPSDKIISGLRYISNLTKIFVIVTNQVGSDGIKYPEGTDRYISLIGKINSAAAEISDNVVECVYGIPVVLKGKIKC